MSDFNYDVFLSHSSKDKAIVRELAERLKADGVRVWFDEWEINPGDMIGKKIEDGLEASRVLVLAMSGNASESEWTTLESWTFRFPDPTNKERRFIPLRLDDSEIKPTLKGFAYVDWREKSKDEYKRLLSSCKHGELETQEEVITPDALRKIISLGHTDWIRGVAISGDGKFALSGSDDSTLRYWELETGRCLKTLEGHTAGVWSVAISEDGKFALSGSVDRTLRYWELETGRCLKTLEGHTAGVLSVAISEDGKFAYSGAENGVARLWSLQEVEATAESKADDKLYTNAKVVLVGESGVGKTGLGMRLCENHWEATESTHGMNIAQLKFPAETSPKDIEREVWLWDFAGQPDYRLIHQLYMDETALGLLVFDPQDGNPFESLGHWEKALHIATRKKGYSPAKLLVAARCDRGGITISKKRFDDFCREHNCEGLFITGAKTGEGCDELKAAIAQHIPWKQLTQTSTSRLFKTLKDALLKLKEDDAP